MLDIREGDSFIVGSETYRVRAVMSYAGWGTSASFRRFATVTATVKRTPAGGSEATVIASLKCTPLDPASQDAQQLISTKAPYRLLETYAADTTSFARVVVEELARI